MTRDEPRPRRVKVEQADGKGGSKRHTRTKKQKNRDERRLAKQDPEVQPGYGKYRGWES